MIERLTIDDHTLLLARTWAARTLWALVLVFAGWVIATWLASRATRGLERAHVEPTLARFLSGLLRWALILTAFVTALGVLGVQTASFAAVVGATGLALALAFQGTLASFAAGVLLIVFRPFRVGDTIRVGLQQGRVDSIDLFTTAIDTSDNRRVILPNSGVFGQTIENLTCHPRRVAELAVPVPAAIDVEDARRALEEAARKVEGRSAAPAPEVQAYEVQAAQTLFRVRVWAATEELATVTDALARAVRRALDALPRRAG